MIPKLYKLSVDGQEVPMAFTMTAIENIENELHQPYTSVSISARWFSNILWFGYLDGHRVEKSTPKYSSKVELLDAVYGDKEVYENVWKIWASVVSFGILDEEDGDEEQEVDKSPKKKGKKVK